MFLHGGRGRIRNAASEEGEGSTRSAVVIAEGNLFVSEGLGFETHNALT